MTHIIEQKSEISNPTVWIVYGVIFAYYILATLFPIDRIIGRIYPVFGAVLLLSAVGVFIGIFVKGYPLVEVWNAAAAGYPYSAVFCDSDLWNTFGISFDAGNPCVENGVG